MEVILINEKIFPSEKILKLLSEEENIVSESLNNMHKGVSLYKSSRKMEELLKEINLENYIPENKNINSGNEFVIVIHNEDIKYDNLNTDTHYNSDAKFEYRNIKVMPQYQRVYVNDKRIALTSLEYKLLVFFINNHGKLISKKIIIDYLWGEDNKYSDPDNSIYTHIKNLKKKLHNSGVENYIHTVYGRGYRFEDWEANNLLKL